MKAVVMAGGEGTRLRPMTAALPKPLLPVTNRPLMGHVLRLLRRHGLTEVVVTVQFLAPLIRDYFGDGRELGMSITYANEDAPRGTAGSVKNAEEALADDRFLVISGDALTDIDLTALIEFHRSREALVTVCLTRVTNPLEFGITIVDDDGRVERFLEKPTWGQVFSDTVNTGIYVMEPEVFAHVPAAVAADWSADVFPMLLKEGLPVYGFVADGYWEDIGTHESYRRAQADVLRGAVRVEREGFEIRPGVWMGEGAEVDPDADLRPPVFIGDYTKVEAGACLGEFTVLGSNVVVKEGAFLERAVVHDNAFIGAHTNLLGCVIGRDTDIMRAARVGQGAVIGNDCVLGEEAIVADRVKIYPSKSIEAGTRIHDNVIWETGWQRALFGPRGVSGIINVEITPEQTVRLTSSYATTLKKGDTVVTARDGSRAARALKQSVISALQAAAINVRDLGMQPAAVARMEASRGNAGGVLIRTTPGVPDSVDIQFVDATGANLSTAHQRHVERVFSRQEFRRAFPGEIGDLTYPGRVVENYVRQVLSVIDTTGIPRPDGGLGSPMRIVVDAGCGTAGLLLPLLVGGLGVDVHTVNIGIDEAHPTQTEEQRARYLHRLGELVASSAAAFGVHLDPLGERVALVDESGNPIADDRALLVVMDLVAAERRAGKIALPVTTTRVAEQVAGFHGVEVDWQPTTADNSAAADPDLILAGDGRGGFVVPEVGGAVDAIAAFVLLVGLIARTKLTLSQIDARIPRAHVASCELATPWAARGAVMREVRRAAGNRPVETIEGLRIIERDGAWAMVLPDPTAASICLWAEAGDDRSAQALIREWCGVVERARG